MAPTDHKGTAEAARMIGNPIITMRKVGDLCLSFLELISTEIAHLAEKHKLDSVDYSEYDDGSPINGSSSPNALPDDPVSPRGGGGSLGSSPETPQSNESEASPVRGNRRLRSWHRETVPRWGRRGFLSSIGEKLRDRFSSTPFASLVKREYAIGPGPKLPHELQDRVKRRYIQLQRIEHRWKKLVQGFLSPPQGEFDTTKVPDLWDCVYYDLVHHRNDVPPAALNVLEEMSCYLIPLQNWTSPSEFGIDKEDKIRIGVETSWRLLQKLMNDSEFMLDEITDSGQPRSNANAQTVGFDATGTPTLLPAMSMGSTPSKGSAMNSPTNAVRQCIVHSHRFKDHEEPSAATGDGPNEARKTPGSSTVRSSSGEHAKRREGSVDKAPKGAAPELRAQLRQAMRDGSDWHPKLHETVAQITGMKSTSKCVRTRIYVTSASTMHSLLNVLVNGDDEHMKSPIDPSTIRDVTDLHYLTHISIRVFEADDYDGASTVHDAERRHRTISSQSTRQDLTRYRVEIGLSPGVQVVDHTSTGLHINHYPPGNRIRESELEVAPLKPVINVGTLKNYYTLQELDTYLTSVLARFHHCVDSDTEPDTDFHDADGETSMSPLALDSTTS
ncbi:hypothetical protein FOZ62_025714 [Perkinsus olseni]|uniref:Inositol hexakisphosphate and diphosphoinositol-pentakisphosphate kinase n=1 Tax=Perkinsus olseni TaxID=32597 RepID=A0A7J6R0U8_PEROL|nr:hypothetical protein FOZ62_025714 [Perkinsus olseni]